MSSKRRNTIAWVLLILAAIAWTVGQYALNTGFNDEPSATAIPGTVGSSAALRPSTINPTSAQASMPTMGELPGTNPATPETRRVNSSGKVWGVALGFAAVILAAIAIIGLRLKKPFLGPDSSALLIAFVGIFKRDLLIGSFAIDIWIYGALTLVVLCVIRELFGWLCSKLSTSWCAVHRLAKRVGIPQISLFIFCGWILAAILIVCWLHSRLSVRDFLVTYAGILCCGAFGGICLWRYAADLHHFQKQLSNFREGQPIDIQDGAFSQDEQQLRIVQREHEEAVHKAVTGERFKVELISNVSHDLRTPLTSILGYSELLQNETLSPEGEEQLRRLHLKAGYMNDLVESLFELTKVSSGVVESKKDEIDLVRLLEQTIGLFDDQLVNAGLIVRRNYSSDAVHVITDGARMHQVFANLLGNAIKYALSGTRIYLEVKETPDRYIVRMMNTASYEMDFKPDEIMQRFARGDKSRSTKGSGLGLAIAQTYTESVGGSFRVSVDGDQFSAIVELPRIERNL